MTTDAEQLNGQNSDSQKNKNPERHTFVPRFRSRPNEANQSAPRRQISGATATVSTLVTVVGQPKTPISAGNGGFKRGLPCLPSNDSINAFFLISKKNIR